MYKVGDKVKYQTIPVKYLGGRSEPSIEKIGIIEEIAQTINKTPCYWIENEKFLIMQSQIIEIVK